MYIIELLSEMVYKIYKSSRRQPTRLTAVACTQTGLTDEKRTVKLLGGELHIKWDRVADLVYMTGPAKIVFEGEVDPDSI